MTELKNSNKRPTTAINPIKGNQIKSNSWNNTNKYPTQKLKDKAGLKLADSKEENDQKPRVYRLMDSNGKALLPKPNTPTSRKNVVKIKRMPFKPTDRYIRFLETNNKYDTKLAKSQLAQVRTVNNSVGLNNFNLRKKSTKIVNLELKSSQDSTWKKPTKLILTAQTKAKTENKTFTGLKEKKTQMKRFDPAQKKFTGRGRTLNTKVSKGKPKAPVETKTNIQKDPIQRKNSNISTNTLYITKEKLDHVNPVIKRKKEDHKNGTSRENKKKFKNIANKEKVNKRKSVQNTETKIQSSQIVTERFEKKIPEIDTKVNVKMLKEKFSKSENTQTPKMPLKTKVPDHHTFPFQNIRASFENPQEKNEISRSTGGASEKLDKSQSDLMKMVQAMRENLQLDHVQETSKKGDISGTLKLIMDTREKYMNTKFSNYDKNVKEQNEDQNKNALSIEAQNLQRRAQTLESTKPFERAYMESNIVENKLLEKRKIQEKSEFVHNYNKTEEMNRKSSTSLIPVEEADPRIANAAAVFKEEIRTSFDNRMIKMAQRYSSQLENARLQLSRRLNEL